MTLLPVSLLLSSSRAERKQCLRCDRRVRSVSSYYCRSCRWTWSLTS